MALSYTRPGVFVEEIASGPRPIEAVGTSTAAFLGEFPDGDIKSGVAYAVNNWDEFVRNYARGATSSTMLAHAVYGFFLNGGGRCYVVNVHEEEVAAGLRALMRYDDISLVATPGFTRAATYDALRSHCDAMRGCFAILDARRDVSDISLLKIPSVVSGPAEPGEADTPASDPEGATGGKIVAHGAKPEPDGIGPPDSDNGAYYYPWLYVMDPLEPRAVNSVAVPPSGHLAGIYARTDARRGVHKAPANEPVYGALGLTAYVTDEEQATLNPSGVNCIRNFAQGQGILVFGARTTAKLNREWIYINVRRLFNLINRSISNGTQWAVFEPNNETLWKQIKRDITGFLMPLWQQGALFGATPEQAFFVKCDAETNPQGEIDRGRLIVLIGIAPVKPAEFVIFRIGQGADGAEVDTIK